MEEIRGKPTTQWAGNNLGMTGSSTFVDHLSVSGKRFTRGHNAPGTGKLTLCQGKVDLSGLGEI